MQRRITNIRRSDDEVVKEGGLLLDFDEIARHGKMTLEESKVAKAYGVYTTRHPNYFMARIVVPGGVLTTSQVRGLSKIMAAYAQGRICLTTRQALQLHYLRIGDLAPMMRDLAKYSLTTYHGCGDNIRNTAACPWASVCEHRRFDVLPYALKTSELIGSSRDLDNLPRKFKITYSGCAGNCGQPYINCGGVVAIVRKRPGGGEETGFRVMIGGGMGWRPWVGELLYGFVPREKIQPLMRAVAQLFRDHGDRFDRSMSRLKVVVEQQGIGECRKIVEGFMDAEGVDYSDFEADFVEDCGPAIPARPMAEPQYPRGDDDQAIARIMVPKGEIDFHSLKRIAELSERYGDKYVYTTNRQNFELHGVDPEKLPELQAEIDQLPVAGGAFFGLDDVVPCVGTTYCPLAVSETRRMYDMLESVVKREKYDPIRSAAFINITGCPNACSPYYIADVGLRGMRIREGQGSVEGYEIRLGGTEQKFGVVLGEFKTEDCARVVETVLDTFLDIRQGDESLADAVWKHGSTGNPTVSGMKPFCEAVDALHIRYEHAPKPAEFSVFTGDGCKAIDLKTMARDIPCQAACPAGTNVPEYIRQLVLNDPDASYRVNQEDNVFPGVLGRICTRPCEPACRHQWTNTKGPVTICHLKRAAADNKSNPAAPLPPWFDEATGKRVAVVGGGPAGLTAARELKRLGHEVVLFEREQVLGGQMAWGIPEFRLPREVVQEEVAAIVDGGIDVRLGEHVDRDRLAQMAEDYDALLVAAGAIRGVDLKIDGLEEADNAISGYEFMRRYNMDDPIPVSGDVVIIGGGFTAVDCADRRRLLGEEHRVTAIMYRRGEEHMSASPDEIWQLRLEGIDVGTLVNPARVRCENGRVEAVIFDRNVLGDDPEDGGKPPIHRVPGSDYEVPCDTMIYAVGQTRTLEILPEGVELTSANRTTHEKLFVSGDFHTGPLDVIHAVADAKDAANAIDEFLTGEKRLDRSVKIVEADETGRLRDHDLYTPAHARTLPLECRQGNEEVELGYNAEELEINARRCYLCNYKFEIDQDKCIHCDWCIKASPRSCIHPLTRLFTDEDGSPTGHIKSATAPDATYIWIESDQCIRCGNCNRACPTYAIPVRKADIVCGPVK